MNFFQTKSNLDFIIAFHNDVLKLWEVEDVVSRSTNSRHSWMSGNAPHDRQTRTQQEAARHNSDYQTIRKSVAKGVSRAQFLAALHNVPSKFTSFPAPAVGGPVIKLGVFEAILADTSHGGVDRQMIYDTLNRTIGACEEAKERAWRELTNPFYFLKNIALVVLKIPFMLIEATGFNVSKFEDHFFGKLFKLLMLLGLVWGLFALGFEKADLVEILKNVISFSGF